MPQGRSTSNLRDAAGAVVDNTSGGGITQAVNIGGQRYVLNAADFPRTSDALEHQMHALSLKRHSHGLLDWEVAASRYRYGRDLQRSYAPSSAAQPDAGRISDQGGTGWQTLALKLVWRPSEAHIIDAGLQQDSFRLRQHVYDTPDWDAGAPAAENSSFLVDTRLRSVFVQDAWSFADRWKTVLGLRAEQWNAWGGLTTSGSNAHAHPQRSERYLSPKAALAYELSDAWVLKASTGRAVRMPTVSELYQGSFNGTGQLVNNDPDLKPEVSWTGELSAEADLGPQRLRITLFREDTQDALYSQTNVTVTPNVPNIQNVDRIRTNGVELAWSAQDLLSKRLDLSSSITYADSLILRNDKFTASVGHWQPRVPRWRATALATWRPDDRWTVSVGARYSGRQYSTLDGSDPNGFTYQGASKYFTTDMRIRWRIDRRWSAAFGIDNLNNYQYWNFHPYPQRTYSAELNFDL